MKKKFLSLIVTILLFVMLFILTGCGEEEEEKTPEPNNEIQNEQTEEVSQEEPDIKSLYLEVLDGKRTYKDNEEGKEGSIQDAIDFLNVQNETVKISYAMLNLNNDDIEDMAVFIEKDGDGSYLILTFEDGTMYGVLRTYRAFENLKTNGYYWASGGADVGVLYKSNFTKGEEDSEELASRDNGIYIVKGKTVSVSEIDEYLEKEFRSKADVEWIPYKEINEEPGTESLEIEERTYTSERGLDGTEAEGTDSTLTLKDGKATWVDNYFGTTKTGTYSIEGNIVKINYTKKEFYNQGTDEDEEETISEQEEYEFDGTALVNKSTSEAYF